MRRLSPILFLATLTACLPTETTSSRERSEQARDTAAASGPTGDPAAPTPATPSTDEPPAAEHPPEDPHGIDVEWVDGPAAGADLTLREPLIGARLTNREPDDRVLLVTPVGDSGTPDRVLGEPQRVVLAAGESAELPIDFGFLVDRGSRFSGAVAFQVESCPVVGGACVTGLSASLFHHQDPASGQVVVYDGEGLCAAHGCGDLDGLGVAEPGTTRLIGGTPKVALRLDEDLPPPPPPPLQVLPGVFDLQVCVAVDVLITDSGLSANGVTEDFWVGAADPVQYLVTGRGFRARVIGNGHDDVYDADPDTGCFSFPAGETDGWQVLVYAYATDSAGNVTRAHDGGTDTSSWYPGNTLSIGFVDQTLQPGGPNWLVVDGRTDDQWTAAAITAFAMRQFHDGHSGVTLSFGWSSPAGNCGDSGSAWGSSASYIESDRAQLIRIGRCVGNITSDTREKMLITHEMGHAMLRLHYGYDGDESPRDQNWWRQDLFDDGTLNPNAPPAGGACYLRDSTNTPYGGSYSMNTVETNSQTFKEAYADFWSARVWNSRDERGTYVYRSVAFDLETWDTFGLGGVGVGGFTSNWCGISGAEADDVSTKGDWLRFLWDVYTDPDCDDTPTRLEMMDLYAAVREAHRDGSFPLTTVTWDQGMMDALLASDLDACVVDHALGDWANWNGI